MMKQYLLFAIAFLTSTRLICQLSAYSFSQSNATYFYQHLENRLGSKSNTGAIAFLDENGAATTNTKGAGIPIGFDFTYGGKVYDRFGVVNNGWIALGQSTYGNEAIDLGQIALSPLEQIGPSNSILRARISAFAASIFGNGINSSLEYELRGESPMRTLHIKWTNYQLPIISGTNYTNINFEIRLHEMDNSIEFVYGDMSISGISSTTNCNIGLGGQSPSDFKNRKTLSDRNWRTTIAGTDYKDDCILAFNSKMPAFETSFKFTPPMCLPIIKASAVQITSDALTLTWPHVSTGNHQYQYALTQNQSPPSLGTSILDSTVMISNLTPNTTYYFHIRNVCAIDTLSEWRSYQFHTSCVANTLPYLELFDTYTEPDLPECYTTINKDSQSPTWQLSSENPLSYPNHIFMDWPGSGTVDDWLILPPLALEKDTSYTISFDLYMGQNQGDVFYLALGTSPIIDSMTFIDTISPNQLYNYEPYYKKITAPATGNYYFSFYTKSYYISIDNIEINKNKCDSLTDLSLSANEIAHVVVDWTYPSTNTTCEYALSLDGMLHYDDIITTSDDSILFTDLQQGKLYTLFLRNKCTAYANAPWQMMTIITKSNIDECNVAASIIPELFEGCNEPFFSSTLGASPSGQPVSSCGGVADDDVWLTFDALKRSHNLFIVNQCNSNAGGGGTRNNQALPLDCGVLVVELYKGNCATQLIKCDTIPGSQSKNISFSQFIPDSTYMLRVFSKDAGTQGQNFGICITSFDVPSNDVCTSAIPLAVSNNCDPNSGANYNLASCVSSTAPTSTCNGGPYYDVWFKFTATATSHLIEALFRDGANGVVELYSGTCASMSLVKCQNSTTKGTESMTVEGLVIGNTYYVRLYDATNIGPNTRISICIKNIATNDECSTAHLLPVTVNTMQNHHAANTALASGTGSCGNNYADDDLWYKFVATHATHLIVVIPTIPIPPLSVPVIEMFEGDCTSNSLQCNATGELLATGLVVGNTYYFRIYSKEIDSGKGNYKVCVTHPPTYYTCDQAIDISVNDEANCNNVNRISTFGAGKKNEVWMKFIATDTAHIITCAGLVEGEPTGLSLYANCNTQFPIVQYSDYGILYYHHFIPGDTYYLRVAYAITYPDYFFIQDTIETCISRVAINDEKQNAIEIGIDTICNGNMESTYRSTPSTVPGNCFSLTFDYDVWYKFTATKTYHRIEVLGSGHEYVEVFNTTTGQSVSCFSDAIMQPQAIGHLNELKIGQSYLVRISIASGTSKFGDFEICIFDAPSNDHCGNAIQLFHPLTTGCDNVVTGTLSHATGYTTSSQKNVWYKFVASDKKAIIRVNALIKGFDPAIKLWNASPGVFENQCTYTQVTQSDDTHLDFEPEMIFVSNLFIGNTYYIEVFGGASNIIDGDFEICLSSYSSEMMVHHSNFRTYKEDTIAARGTWHQAIALGQIYFSGNTKNLVINEINIETNDSLLSQHIDKAYLYFEPNAYPKEISTPDDFSKFGKAGTSIIGPYLPPILFDEAMPDANGKLVFKGNYTLPTLFSQFSLNLLRQKFYLVYDVNCSAPLGQRFSAECNSIKLINSESLVPANIDSLGLAIGNLSQYHTRKDGNWALPSTWMCDQVPPNNYNLPQVNINHHVVLDDSINTGDMVINYNRSLTMKPHSYLELGRNSTGNNNGYSNKYLDCTQGSFSMDSATLVVNGAMSFGTHGGDQKGNGLNGAGYYKMELGTNTIAYGTQFYSYKSHDFCVQNGVVSDAVDHTPQSSHTLKQIFKASKSQNRNSNNPKIKNALYLDVNEDYYLSLIQNKSDHLQIEIPKNEHENYTLELEKVEESPVKAYAMPGHIPLEMKSIQHYRGKLNGNEKSLVTMSIFNNEMVAFIDDGSVQQSLIKKDDQYLLYALMPDESAGFRCDAHDDGDVYDKKIVYRTTPASNVYQKCIKVLVEVERDIVLDKGSIGAYNYVSALMNTTAALYAQDSINISVSEILMWTNQNSPYTGNTTHLVLDKFSNDKNFYNGDMALFMSYQFDGGIGYIDGLCNPVRKYSCAYTGIDNNYNALPAYSWSVYVIAHELGHVLGSRHTHACVWNGNGTPIDGCFTPEGSCASGPIPEQGGTIMSYCHFAEEGIHFSNGFGPQPLNVIYDNIENAECLHTCNNAACTQNELALTIKTDANPDETYWMLTDENNQKINSGGPYFTSNTIYNHAICVPDGCYTLKIYDSFNQYPSGTLDVNNSTMTFDGNDGTAASVHKTNFNMLSSNFQFNKIKINFLDPPTDVNNSFSFFAYNNGAYYLNGTMTTGGGDDTLSNNHFGFLISNMNLIEGYNPRLRIDTLHVQGGLYTANRHTRAAGNFNWLGTLIVDQGCEYAGRVGVDENIINNGFITNRREANDFISFGKSMDIGNHYINGTYPQTISGSGYYRSSFSDPYPSNSNENRINKMICNNSKGIHLNTNLNVYDELILRRGLLYTNSNAVLSLGDTAHQGRLFSDPSNALVFSAYDTISSIDMWNGGLVYGPMRRYFSGPTLPKNSIFPLGDSTIDRSIAIMFANTNPGSVTAKYVKQDPTGNGLPLFNEQNTSVMGVSPTAYWHLDSVGVSGNYDIHVNAQNFEEIKGKNITSLNNVRIIKRHSNTWQHSSSTTTTGPSLLSKVEAKNFSGFSDFGIGIGQDTSACGLWVYNDTDNEKGSLRYVLNNCANNGNVIKIVSTIDTVYLTIDSLLINKDVSIVGTNQSNYPKIMAGNDNKAFEIAAANTVRLSDLKIVGDNSNAIATVKNNGALTLKNIIMQNKKGKSILINTAILNIEKGVRIE